MNPNNLPVRLSSFIGREHEVKELTGYLADHRLVTIVGSGGAGKTRLAIQTASAQLDQFPDGVWWLELAPITDPSTLASVLARAVIGELEGSRPAIELVTGRLRDHQALLVFDNCEHLVEAAAEAIDTILQRCPNVRVLGTSRIPLNVPSELTWRVPPLSLPETPGDHDLATIRDTEAVTLFFERAWLVRPTFVATTDNGAIVAEICRSLDGIPLAIEFAAARTRSLTPQAILDGLSDALRILSGGSSLVMPRHRTLEASIGWSFGLLDDPSRNLLLRLSVFVGSFDLAGAEAVCTDPQLSKLTVLDLLDRLVEHSLVESLEGDRVGRFSLLETVRQFCHRRLDQEGSLRHWRERHANYYAGIAKRVGPTCETSTHFASVAALDLDHDNLRAALEWFRDEADVEALSAMVCDLAAYWDVGGERSEGATWASRALELGDDDPSVLRARLLAYRGEWLMTTGNFASALEDSQRAMAMGSAIGDPKASGRASSTLTTALSFVDLAAWRPQWEKTVELLSAANDTFALVGTLTWEAAPLIRRGYTREGLEALERARPHVFELGQPLLIGSQLMWEAFALAQAGELLRAEELAVEALETGALGNLREEVPRLIISLCRATRGLPRRTAGEVARRNDRARREGEHLTEDLLTVLVGVEQLGADPAGVVRNLDVALAHRRDMSPVARCETVAVAVLAAFLVGDLHDTRRRANYLLELAEQVDHVLNRAKALTMLAALDLLEQETSRADDLVREAISLHAKHGNLVWLNEAIEVLACVGAACGDFVEAARLFGAIASMRDAMEIRMQLPFKRIVGAARRATVDALGSEYAVAFAGGANLDVASTLAYIERTRGQRGRPSIGWDSLSPTERQVADLVHEGLSNREVAVRLLMSPDTVKSHLSHIFTKLGINKRAQLAVQVASRKQ
jgi:predicted ATPase/DNA-binding CsgD family transcriptional regulator